MTPIKEPVHTDIDIVPTWAAGFSTRIRFSAILCLMQDAAYAHAAELGVGYDKLAAMHRTFVLARMQLAVSGELPCWGEKMTLTTWPSALERLFFFREFELSCEGREPFLRASSSWLLIDTDTRHPARPDAHLADFDLRRTRPMGPDSPERLRWDDAATAFDKRRARASDMDPNGHVNNTRYVDWVTDAIAQRHGLDAKIASLSINFLAEVRMDEDVKISLGEGAEGITVQGETDKRSFTSRVRLAV